MAINLVTQFQRRLVGTVTPLRSKNSAPSLHSVVRPNYSLLLQFPSRLLAREVSPMAIVYIYQHLSYCFDKFDSATISLLMLAPGRLSVAGFVMGALWRVRASVLEGIRAMASSRSQINTCKPMLSNKPISFFVR